MSGAMVDDVSTKVQGFIRGARPVGQPKYLSDTSVEMEYSVPMSGISDIVLPPVTVPMSTQPANDNATTTAQSNSPTAGGVTGIIIDARGLNARPLWHQEFWIKMKPIYGQEIFTKICSRKWSSWLLKNHRSGPKRPTRSRETPL